MHRTRWSVIYIYIYTGRAFKTGKPCSQITLIEMCFYQELRTWMVFLKKKLFTLYQQIRKQFEWKYHLGSFTLMKFSQYMVNISEKKMTENFHSIDMHFKHIMKMKLALIAYSILERFFSLCEHCLYGLIFPPGFIPYLIWCIKTCNGSSN